MSFAILNHEVISKYNAIVVVGSLAHLSGCDS
jgi:hypothetical protein